MKFTQIVAAVFLAASAYAATADTAATDAAAVAGQFQRGCLDLCLDIATDCAKRGRRDNCDREFSEWSPFAKKRNALWRN